MTVRSPFKRKITDLTYNYGRAAGDYFRDHPICELCGEERLVCLTLHHVHGKQEEVYQTLCFNCHMYIEAKKATKDFTYKDEKIFEQKKVDQAKLRRKRNLKIVKLLEKHKGNKSLVARLVGLSRKGLYDILDRQVNSK